MIAVKVADKSRMRVDRIMTLAAIVENGLGIDRKGRPIGFNMRIWAGRSGYVPSKTVPTAKCGTVACIGGHAEILWGGEDAEYLGDDSAAADAADKLGLDMEAAFELFYPTGIADYNRITAKRAARVLRRLAKTGVVDWSIR